LAGVLGKSLSCVDWIIDVADSPGPKDLPTRTTQDPMDGSRDTFRTLCHTAAGLREENRALLKRMRGLVHKISEQHARLEKRPLKVPGGNGWEELGEQFNLTDRELEVARLLAEGRRNTAIAAELGISPHTARHHTQHVLAKLGVHSRAEAAARLSR
jgi:DNA-binding CsgD family transcriptional regulator